MNYRFDFEVKYLLVERDLKSKIQIEEQVYDKEDIENICLELYKIDILKVFKLKEYNQEIIIKKISEISRILENEKDFLEIKQILQKKMNNSEYKANTFLFLFSYDLFFYFHKLISHYFIYKNIDSELKNDLIKNINIII